MYFKNSHLDTVRRSRLLRDAIGECSRPVVHYQAPMLEPINNRFTHRYRIVMIVPGFPPIVHGYVGMCHGPGLLWGLCSCLPPDCILENPTLSSTFAPMQPACHVRRWGVAINGENQGP